MSFTVAWNEDSSVTVLGRITARDGSGAVTGIDGEGRWLQQADIDTITCKVFDITADATTPIAEPTVNKVTDVLDTPVTSKELWTIDETGYNFQHDLGPNNFPTGGNRVRVEYKVTLTGGTVFHGVYEGPVNPLFGS